MKKLINIVKQLRSPTGCPWDIEQTHASLIPHLLEETWEVVDEIKRGSLDKELKEELGDLLFQIILHAQIADERGAFTLDEVVESISAKMIRRHPHVFKKRKQNLSKQELRENWHQQKLAETKQKSILDGFSETVPALMNSLKIGQRVASVGFDWESKQDVLDKVKEELVEVENEMTENNHDRLEDEIGDLLFSVTCLARHYKINPEVALHRTNNKFKRRFKVVEEAIEKAKKIDQRLSLAEMEEYWVLAKKSDRK